MSTYILTRRKSFLEFTFVQLYNKTYMSTYILISVHKLMANNLLISENLNLIRKSHPFTIFTPAPAKCQMTLPRDRIELRVGPYIY